MISERDAPAAFFRSVDRGAMVVLPPNPERFDQSEGHDEAQEIARSRGLSSPDWMFWHRQSAWVFDGDGNLTAGLLIHWGGEHARVAEALAGLPEPVRVIDHGPGGAFEITSDALAARQAEPFPEVADTAEVKKRIALITAKRRKDAEWSDVEIAWLNGVLTHGELAAQGYVVRWIAGSERLTDDALEALLTNWKRIYTAAPKDVLVWDLLRTLQRRDDPRLEGIVDECVSRSRYTFSSGVAHFLVERGRAGQGTPADLPRLYQLACTPGKHGHTPGNGAALRGWLQLRADVEGRTVAEVAAEAQSDPGFDAAALGVLRKEVDRGNR